MVEGRNGEDRSETVVRRWGPPRHSQMSTAWVQALIGQGRIKDLEEHARQGRTYATARLAEWYAQQGRMGELRDLAGSDNPRLVAVLADLAAVPEDGESWVAVMKVRLEAREKEARDLVTTRLRAQGRVAEAVELLRAGPLPMSEWHLLVHLLLQQDRVAEVWAATDFDARPYGHAWLVEILAEEGRVEELRRFAALGLSYSADLLAHSLARLGRVEEGIDVLQQRVDAGEERSLDRLVEFLTELGLADRAVAALHSRHVPSPEDSTVGYYVARLLDEQGRTEDAISVLRECGTYPYCGVLAELLVEQGRVLEAVRVLDEGMTTAEERFQGRAWAKFAGQQIDLLIQHEWIDELRIRADTSHAVYRSRLAAHLREQGLTQELRSRHSAGDLYASVALAETLAEDDRIDELRALAEETGEMSVTAVLRHAVSAQHLEVPYRLYMERQQEADAALRARQGL